MIFGTAESFDEQGHVVALGHTGVEKAIALGFTEFDTAPVYGNQHEMSFPISLGNPIRVIRGSQHNSPYSPVSGYIYSGLYRIESVSSPTGAHGFLIYRFKLN